MSKFFSVLVVALFLVLGLVSLLEFMAGCGETYVDSKGERHAYGCLLITP